jgi:hypothetical protein
MNTSTHQHNVNINISTHQHSHQHTNTSTPQRTNTLSSYWIRSRIRDRKLTVWSCFSQTSKIFRCVERCPEDSCKCFIVVILWIYQQICGLPTDFPQAELSFMSLTRLPQVNSYLRSLNIHLYSGIKMTSIMAKVPNIRSLKITGFEYRESFDFSFLRTCPNLEIFHISRISRAAKLTQNDAAKFSHLEKLIELDLHDCFLSPRSMLRLLESLPKSIRRFRHLSDVAMAHFPFIVQQFSKLQTFSILGALRDRPRVCWQYRVQCVLHYLV